MRRLAGRLLIASFLFHLLAAWFTVGYHHPDEYFQVVEFASYKLGITPANDLAWEFNAHIRPALQPAMVYGLCKLLSGTNPLLVTFLLRFISAMPAWMVSILFVLLFINECKTENARKILVWLSCLLWFLPYIHARFSSENWSSIFFFAGLILLIKVLRSTNKTSALLLLFSGCLLGFSFVTRFHAGFMLLGLGLWLLLFRKLSFQNLIILFSGILIALFTGFMLDRWFYGAYHFTAIDYFKVNVLQGKSSEWGVSPWWDYFRMIFINLIPPFSIIAIACMLYFFVRHYKHMLTWICVPFFIIHMLNPHKELRFLFPLLTALPVIIALSLDRLYINPSASRFLNSKPAIISAKVFIGINILLMLISSLKPANEMFTFFNFIYSHYEHRPINLYTLSKNPYNDVQPVNFYKPKTLSIIPLSKDSAFQQLPHAESTINLMFVQNADQPDTFPANYRLVYQSIPPWITKYNYNNWVKRTRVWSVYEISER